MSIHLSLPHISLSPVFPSFSFQAPDQTGHLAIAQERVCLLTTLGHFLYMKYMTKSSAHSPTRWEYFPFPFTPCHAATVHLQFAPMYHINPSINQAQAFSSSFSWLYRTLHVAIGSSQGTGTGYVLMRFTGALWPRSGSTPEGAIPSYEYSTARPI